MNYRHIYHAGVYADIIKHLTLVAILEQLLKKDKPFAVLDAFAGTGMYDLKSEQALKTNESEHGIGKLIKYANSNNITDPLLQKYLKLIKMPGGENFYPGSPMITKKILRSDDRLIACELHPEDYKVLRKLFYSQPIKPAVGVHHQDAYQAVQAFLPFKEKRGLIFLDPPFEVKNEFEKLLAALRIIAERAANCCTLIWYPIKNELQVKEFYANYQTIGFKETLKIEFGLKDGSRNLHKCGLLIANPPNIKQELTQTFKYLTEEVYAGRAHVRVSS